MLILASLYLPSQNGAGNNSVLLYLLLHGGVLVLPNGWFGFLKCEIWCFCLSNFLLISVFESLCIWMDEARYNSRYYCFQLLGRTAWAKITWLYSWITRLRWNIFLNNHTKLHVYFGRLQMNDVDKSLQLWPLSQAQALIPLMKK